MLNHTNHRTPNTPDTQATNTADRRPRRKKKALIAAAAMVTGMMTLTGVQTADASQTGGPLSALNSLRNRGGDSGHRQTTVHQGRHGHRSQPVVVSTPTSHHRDRDARRDRHDHKPRFEIGVRSGHYVTVNERRYVAGHYTYETQRVCVQPESRQRVWCPPVYETRRLSCGRYVRVLVKAGHYTYKTIPARYETRTVKVWVPGHYETVQVRKYVKKPGIYVSARF